MGCNYYGVVFHVQKSWSLNHLFLHCTVAWELRSMIFCLLGVSWVILCARDVVMIWFGTRSIGGTWKAVPLCFMWCIWRERNARCFEGQEFSVVKLNIYC